MFMHGEAHIISNTTAKHSFHPTLLSIFNHCIGLLLQRYAATMHGNKNVPTLCSICSTLSDVVL